VCVCVCARERERERARANFVLDSLIYLEPVHERFYGRINVMKFRNFGDGTSSRIEKKLKTIILSGRLIEL